MEAVGWRPTLLGFAGVALVAGVAVFLLARRSPADAGLEPIENGPEQPTVTLRETGAYLRNLLGDPDQWLVSITFFATIGTPLTLIGLWDVRTSWSSTGWT